jgi:uncharacterized protein YpmB
MKHFPFKILILCILMPPVLYIASVQVIETKLQSLYSGEIEDIYIGDTRPLFDGSLTIADAIARNIDQYIQSKELLSWGVRTAVTVTTPGNTIVYPDTFRQEVSPQSPIPAIETAKENYAALNKGFVVKVDVKIALDQFLSIALLATFLFISILVFGFYFKKSSQKAAKESRQIQDEIQRLMQLEHNHQDKLNTLNEQKNYLSGELKKTRKIFDSEKEKASKTEDGMIDEIMSLEKSMQETLSLQHTREKEIEILKNKIAQYEKGELKSNKQKVKASDAAQKRFRTLYKNLLIHDRAVSGFVSLTQELQLKAEEVMLQLHDDPKRVPVKRKVFGKKNRETVYEVLFSYKGRLYYRSTHDKKLEILSIGTKHTQTKDLTFLDQL